MKHQFLITLAAVAASVLTAQAQVTFQSSGGQTTFKKDSSVKSGSYTINRSVKPPVYILPNGQLVPDNKVDSVAKAWNGLTMQRDLTKNPVEIRLYPITSQAAKELAASKIKQEDDLHRRLIGRPAPDFTLTDINNKVWHLSDLKGKIVVLNFWFTECQPCVAEMPTLNKLKKKYTGPVSYSWHRH